MKRVLLLTLITAILSAQEILLTPKQIIDLGITVVPLVKTDTFSLSNLPATVVIPPRQLSLASSLQEGVIQKTLFTVGDMVKSGQTVALIASAEGITLQREYIQMTSRLSHLLSLAKKDETLYKEGIISEREYMRSRQEVDLMNADVQEKRAMMQLMGVPKKSGEGKASILSATSAIRAPINGIIIEQMAITGQRIDAMTPVYKIADLSTLWIEIQVQAPIASAIKIGDKVRTNLGATGDVIKISSGVESQNQSVIVRARITNHQNLIKPGQFVQAAISAALHNSISIPKSALIRQKGDSYIFIKTLKGFYPLKVNVVKEECTTFLISGNLRGTEQIAAKGIVNLKGMWQNVGSSN